MTTEVKADAENKTDDVTTPEGTTATPASTATPEEIQQKLEQLTEELNKKEELLKKVRKFEKENKDAAERALAEQGKFKELYEAEVQKRAELEGRMKDSAINSALNEALKDSGAASIATVMKLIDRNKIGFDGEKVDTDSIKVLIKELKTSDPVLFAEQPKPVPPVRKAGEGDVVGGFEKEIRAAKTQKQIEDVMRKYGKL